MPNGREQCAKIEETELIHVINYCRSRGNHNQELDPHLNYVIWQSMLMQILLSSKHMNQNYRTEIYAFNSTIQRKDAMVRMQLCLISSLQHHSAEITIEVKIRDKIGIEFFLRLFCVRRRIFGRVRCTFI